MRARWHTAVYLLQLLRIELVLSAVGNAWLVAFLAYHPAAPRASAPPADSPSLPAALLLGGLAAGGLAAYGIALNDVLDARHDRAFSPLRPIPAGHLRLKTAMAVAVLCLLAALAAAVFLGQASMLLCLAVAAGALFYNTTGKHFSAAGILLVALIRAVSMFIPAPGIGYVWPIWLTMTHVTVCATVAHALEGKRPRLRAEGVWAVAAGWAFWSMALIGWMTWGRRGSPLAQERPELWAGPLLAAGGFFVWSWTRLSRTMRPLRIRRAAGAAFLRQSMLWLIVYDALWLLGAGLYLPGALLAALFLVASGGAHLVATLSRWRTAPPTYVVTPE